MARKLSLSVLQKDVSQFLSKISSTKKKSTTKSKKSDTKKSTTKKSKKQRGG